MGPLHRCNDGTGDVFDVDAIENLSRLDDGACRAVAYIIEGAAARAINAGQSKHCGVFSSVLSEAEPLLFCRQAALATLGAGLGLRLLIDPAALRVAIDANG